jgi:hypothetical protein
MAPYVVHVHTQMCSMSIFMGGPSHLSERRISPAFSVRPSRLLLNTTAAITSEAITARYRNLEKPGVESSLLLTFKPCFVEW